MDKQRSKVMKIAIATDDLKTIRSGHFGESKYYRIFTIENDRIVHEEVRENPYVKNDDHEHGQAKNIMQLLKDCDLFLARGMGMHSIPKLLRKGKKPVITKTNDISEALGNLLNKQFAEFKCIDENTMKFIPCHGGV